MVLNMLNILGCLDRYFWALEMLNTGNQKIRLRFWLTVRLCSKDGPGKAEAAERIPTQLGSRSEQWPCGTWGSYQVGVECGGNMFDICSSGLFSGFGVGLFCRRLDLAHLGMSSRLRAPAFGARLEPAGPWIQSSQATGACSADLWKYRLRGLGIDLFLPVFHCSFLVVARKCPDFPLASHGLGSSLDLLWARSQVRGNRSG